MSDDQEPGKQQASTTDDDPVLAFLSIGQVGATEAFLLARFKFDEKRVRFYQMIPAWLMSDTLAGWVAKYTPKWIICWYLGKYERHL